VPTWSSREEKAIYDTWWAVKTKKGRWLTLVRAELETGRNVYTTYGDDAKRLAMFTGMTLAEPPLGEYRVRFGESALITSRIKANEKHYRVIIVDAPLDLWEVKK
jgi:hypothetical protein